MTKAEEFLQTMEEIWSMITLPSEDGGGGITILQHPDYKKFCNARSTAKLLGARRTGTTRREGDWWPIYRFQDKSGIAIQKDGNGVSKLKSGKYYR